MRIGILTGGGDVPGLNPCIKAVVNRVHDEGHDVIGIRRGWDGLLSFNPADPASTPDKLIPLTPEVVRTVDRTGGTFLHTSRTNPGRVRTEDVPDFLADRAEGEGPHDFTSHALEVLEHHGIDVLIPIGGDDTLSYGLRMHQEGVPVIAIPKTMDNDVNGTDYCIGFSTAVTRGVEFIHNLRTSTGSHERIAVIELFGRYSGETSLVTAYLAGVDRAVISEVPFDVDKLAGLLMEDKAANPSNYAMITISEGARPTDGDIMLAGTEDAYGHRKLGGIGAMFGTHGTDRRENRPPAGRVPDALRPPRLAGPHGRHQLRRHGSGPCDRWFDREDGGAARWDLHVRTDFGDRGGCQASGCR
jgi:6-phosphofructokinase 1